MAAKRQKRRVEPKVPPPLDLSYLHAVPILIGEFRSLNLYLIGCGGSGSWLAPSVVRIARVLRDQRRVDVNLTFVDPDVVETANVFRQHFCDAEVGQPKAATLAARYGVAWGIEIQAITARFDRTMLSHRYGAYQDSLTVLIGCVDNAAARKSIAEALDYANYGAEQRPSAWWLDCGNSWASGQVLLGATTRPNLLARAFDLPTVCSVLPAPSLQHPELLQPRPEELGDSRLSCEEMLARNAQSLTVNQMIAAIAADYLTGLLLGQDLCSFATYFDLASKTVRTKYITPEAVAAAVDAIPSELFTLTKRRNNRRR